MNFYWKKCPACGAKVLKLRNDTSLKNFPMFCKRCKHEEIITIEPMSRILVSKI
ncbi:MAG: cysteine-rich KTR domain-containing protein [Clostridiales bacterium]|nr:cysteine-rich KTR domain-containing protein [Clostridiales bacterium]